MTNTQKLEKLANETDTPCVTISLNTHRTHPDSEQDRILLKNLLKEAEYRVMDEYEKKEVAGLLNKINAVAEEIDVNYNLDSMHLFLSNNTKEIVKSIWKVNENTVHVSDHFSVRPLLKSVNREEEYYILLLSQSGARLYIALNDGIEEEISNDNFPFPPNALSPRHPEQASDGKQVDNLIGEYLNQVDKALVKEHNQTGLQCVVICTEDNYTRLQQVSDKPGMYHGYAAIDYNNTAPHQVVKQAWAIMKDIQKNRRTRAIGEMKEAVSRGTVLTDLQEIYQAAIDGRGDLLLINPDYVQPVEMESDRTFNLATDGAAPNTVDDIVSVIAWEVASKKGRAVFTGQEDLEDLGKIALKTRY